MPDAYEVELKFLCAPKDLDAVLAAAPAGADDSRELISVYFDTPDRALEKAGASLRVRESRGRRVQTLKRGAGLRREEHEQDIEGLRPEGDLGPLLDLLPVGVEALRPAFNVRVIRRQRTFHYQGAEIELAADLGEVADGPRSSPICEVELELKSGSPAALFALAREMVQAAPLNLSFDSKADRGRALAAGDGDILPARRPEPLPPKATAGMVFQSTARLALAQISANAGRLREQPNPAAIHGLRVAVRRLRSAIATFKPLLEGDAEAARIKDELRRLAKASDEARNLDVMEHLLFDIRLMPEPPGGALEASIGQARKAAHRGVCDTVSEAGFRTLMVDALAWVETGAWLVEPAAHQPARAFARLALDRRLRQVLKQGKGLDRASDETRHALRIAVKKLRYAADGFQGLFPAKAAKRFAAPVKAVQDGLGALNDAATAEPLIARLNLAPEPAFEAGKRLGMTACLRDEHLAQARRGLKALGEAKAYWRKR